jgi:hypothetical protein
MEERLDNLGNKDIRDMTGNINSGHYLRETYF